MTPQLAVRLNALALYAISAILIVAFYWQMAYGELPCPLCQLQRVAFTAPSARSSPSAMVPGRRTMGSSSSPR